jgi:hypothetical protein
MATPADLLAAHYRRTNARVLAVVEELDDDRVRLAPAPGAHSVAFNLWHLARWADDLAAQVPAMTPVLTERLGPGRQIWEAEGLGSRWGFPAGVLGHHDTGMLMDDGAAAGLPMPPKAELIDYARRAFAAAERAVAAVGDQLLEPDGRGGSPASTAIVGDAVATHLEHNNRHLGEIECLRGLLGLRGSATR